METSEVFLNMRVGNAIMRKNCAAMQVVQVQKGMGITI